VMHYYMRDFDAESGHTNDEAEDGTTASLHYSESMPPRAISACTHCGTVPRITGL
jgi:hypothetical protein